LPAGISTLPGHHAGALPGGKHNYKYSLPDLDIIKKKKIRTKSEDRGYFFIRAWLLGVLWD
jgi:hypothetical protein